MEPKTAIPVHQEKIRDFCSRWKVAELSLFGSVLREDFHPGSDVDVAVKFGPGESWDAFDIIQMKTELEKIFGRPVDLLEEKAVINPYIRNSISDSKKVVYAAG